MKKKSGYFLKMIISCLVLIVALFSINSFYSCSTCSKSDQGDTTTSLYKNYQNYFKIGVALSVKDLDDSMTVSVAKKQFNSITAENAMKWEFIHPEPGKYNFEPADKFVKFGEENGMQIVGHVLIWHSQTPAWVFTDEAGNRVSRDTLLARMHDHIKTVVGRYKGRVDCWDVVNEAVGDDGTIRKNLWYEIIGIDYIEKAFKYAHEADPDAVLIYNDYSVPDTAKRDLALELIRNIKAKGIRIDAVGMQAHYHLDYPRVEDLEQSIIDIAESGLRVMITEMDINILPHPWDFEGANVAFKHKYDSTTNPYPDALPDSMQKVLADRYVSFFKIFNRHHNVIDRVTLWGVQDGRSWLNNWPIYGRSSYPLLFDRNFQPKPAFWAVAGLVKNESTP